MTKYEDDLTNALEILKLKRKHKKAIALDLVMAGLYRKAYKDGHSDGYRIAEIECRGY